jgi:diguanylate cyclase (GGDEF)-like protein
MKKLLPIAAIVLGCSVALHGAPPALTTLQAIHALSNDQAKEAYPVAFEATVTYFRGYERTLFVQDGEDAIYVQAVTKLNLLPGDRILIHGTTVPSFRPFVLASSISVLGHGSLPKSTPATFRQLASAEFDCRRVTVRGTVVTADSAINTSTRTSTLRLFSTDGYIDATIDNPDPGELGEILDAEVELTGAVSGRFDGKMQQTGVLLHLPSLADVTVLKRANTSPWSLPITPMERILSNYSPERLSQRIRVHGTITYFQPNTAVVLQSGTKSLWIQTQTISPLHVGEEADATGFPDVQAGFLAMSNAEIRETPHYAPITPVDTHWQDLTSSKHGFDLVAIDGQVVTAIRKASQDEYVLKANGYMFSAIFRHSGLPGFPDPPLVSVPIGAKVRVVGICLLDNSNPFEREVPFNILLRSPADMSIIAPPPILSIRNLLILVGLLVSIVLAVGAKGWTLERKVRRQTAALAARTEAEAALQKRHAQLEQRRSRILEDINGARPLAEILEQILDLASFCMEGSRCWCELNDGALFGNRPADLSPHRIVRELIQARAGSPVGTIFAAFEANSQSSAAEMEALSISARLATLAIETRLLYTDLLHRSEFDLLTDLHNRFSLDKQLDKQIDRVRMQGGMFGLIYIDLDEFKQVNDYYGHHIGDLYLQEVSARMKRQLRSSDLLARLGGDEFAALIGVVPDRTGVDEVAHRLERCFDEPFVLDGYRLRGSASVGIALYPVDGTSKDGLFNAADVAMYAIKDRHRQVAAAMVLTQANSALHP